MFGKEIRCLSPELRAVEDDGVKRIAGYAAVFDSWSENLGWFREKIKPGAFRNALAKSDTVCLYNHDANMVLGRVSNGTLRLKEDERGLLMEVDLPNTQYAQDLFRLIERGDIKQQSFGFTVETDEWKRGEPEERTIVEVKELFDVSPVTYPAYPDTTVAKRSLDNQKSSAIAGTEDAIVFENENIDIDLLLTTIHEV